MVYNININTGVMVFLSNSKQLKIEKVSCRSEILLAIAATVILLLVLSSVLRLNGSCQRFYNRQKQTAPKTLP